MQGLRLLCFILCIATVPGYGQTKQTGSCEGISTSKPEKIFVSFDGGPWRKYPSLDAIPRKAEAGFDRAEVFRSADGKYKVRMVNSTEETGMTNDYCFGADGKLIDIKSDFVGAMWGWGARREFKMIDGKLQESSTEYYSPDTGKAMAKPQYDASLEEFRAVKIYRRVADLPFKVGEATASN